MAYFCNFDIGTRCTGDRMDSALAQVSAQCGQYQAGWDTTDSLGAESYGYEAAGSKFCGRGTG